MKFTDHEAIWKKDVEEVARLYREKIKSTGLYSAKAVDHRSFTEHNAFFPALLDGINLEGDISILDIGCGKGELITYLNHYYPRLKIRRYLGIDLIDEYVEYCKSEYPAHEFKRIDFMSPLFTENDRFELVIALGTLVKWVHFYDDYVFAFIQKMLFVSSKHVLFNLISDVDMHSGNYLEKKVLGHSTSFPRDKLNTFISKLPQIVFRLFSTAIYTDSTDLFIQIERIT